MVLMDDAELFTGSSAGSYETLMKRHTGNLPDMKGFLYMNYLGYAKWQGAYFFAGDAVVLYGNKYSGIYKKISRLRKSLQTGEIRLLHVFKEDIFCNEIGKTVSSIVDGPVLEEYLIERM